MLARPGFRLLAPRLRPEPQRIRKAVFPVGGLGTRFLPATKAVPKEMLPVVDKPLIQYAVEEAKAAGIEEFIFVTSPGKEAIRDHLAHSRQLEALLHERGKIAEAALLNSWLPDAGQVTFVQQPEPLGLGHAVSCARAHVGSEPFAVLLPDDLILAATPCLRQMVDAHADVGGNLVAVMPVPRSQVSRYGVIDPVLQQGRLIEASGMVEKPPAEQAPSTLAVIGRYILQPDIFQLLEAIEAGVGGEIQLTDGIARMISDHALHGFQFEGRRFDCGDKLGFLEANIAFALDRSDLGPGTMAMVHRYAQPRAEPAIGADIRPPATPDRIRARV